MLGEALGEALGVEMPEEDIKLEDGAGVEVEINAADDDETADEREDTVEDDCENDKLADPTGVEEMAELEETIELEEEFGVGFDYA
ncbi:uncharacterized protein K460DRAFT_403457 [Cucurbitaria berberidis CBS 394.84]|uniref:Uncharacterized protein n=1 Tax=Cucurbitaria berberidis CBS 394.84 TaxID=1168544 RepID=A0A9P4GMS0_9PLEO|nr:uncharacterized protein K460DRAFT_403457 [Cucurbitaria berberidis CBS 394.84]KAF1848161.1 hypothetical protein K460DRAFT_403457 [Cucurbitaria berberidis CBS 394.84]